MTTQVDEPEVKIVVDDKGTPMPGDEPEPTPDPVEDVPSVTDTPSDGVLPEDGSSDPPTDTEPKGDSTDEPKGDETTLLSPEVIEELGKAYGKDLIQTEGIKQTVAEMVEAEVARQTQESNRNRDQSDASRLAIDSGRKAILKLTEIAAAAKDNLSKAADGKQFDPNAVDSQVFADNIKTFSTAIVADFQHQYERAVEDGFQETFREVLPEMTDENIKELGVIISEHAASARVPENSNQARRDFIRDLFGFVSKRGIEHGRHNTLEAIKDKQSVAEKVADSNAVRVAKAKIEAEKSPPVVQPGSEPAPSGATLEAYREAVKLRTPEGNIQAQAIAMQMASA